MSVHNRKCKWISFIIYELVNFGPNPIHIANIVPRIHHLRGIFLQKLIYDLSRVKNYLISMYK